jgi:hypothetical protein
VEVGRDTGFGVTTENHAIYTGTSEKGRFGNKFL